MENLQQLAEPIRAYDFVPKARFVFALGRGSISLVTQSYPNRSMIWLRCKLGIHRDWLRMGLPRSSSGVAIVRLGLEHVTSQEPSHAAGTLLTITLVPSNMHRKNSTSHTQISAKVGLVEYAFGMIDINPNVLLC
jgi:hypothetical protein